MSIKPNQFKELLDRYLAGKASPEEARLLDDFFNSYEKEVLHDLTLQSDDRIKAEIRERILKRIPVREKARRQLVPKTLWRMAASVALIAIAAYLVIWYAGVLKEDQPAVVRIEQFAPRGQKLSLELPDGSKVILNSETYISYPEKFSDNNREVTLSGEAYFEVKPDILKPFVVLTDQTTTEVLGTTFNINVVKGSKTEITLIEGSVKVATETGERTVLKPHQQAVIDYASVTLRTQDIDVENFTSWKDNVIYFNKTRLAEAVPALEKWYNVEIEVVNPALNQCIITGKYQEEPLENVLHSFEFLLNANIERQDERHITINGKGCK